MRGIDIRDYKPWEPDSEGPGGDENEKEPDGREDADRKETDGQGSDQEDPGAADSGNSSADKPEPEDSSTDQPETEGRVNPLLTEGVLKAAPGLHSQADSARTTFCLSAEAQALFKDLSGRTGRPQKALLGTALRLCQTAWQERPDRLQKAAQSVQAGREVESERTPMAIAPDVRDGLNDLAEKTGLPRDQLVELGIRLARATVEEQIERLLRPHEDILADLRALREEIEEVKDGLSDHKKRGGPKSPDRDDPVEVGLSDMLRAVGEMIEAEIESGQPIEEDRQFI